MKEINKFDFYIFLLISSLAAGQIGGALQPVRLLSLLFIPILLGRISHIKSKYVTSPRNFFTFCFIWASFSLVWTYNFGRGLEELIYYFIHFISFMELVVFSLYAKSPLKSIALGWVTALIITSIIALWELQTYNHLRFSKIETGKMANYGDGNIVMKQFAAATFFNYNYLELFNCYCAPFLIYLLLRSKEKIEFIIYFILLAVSTYIVIANASRGAIITMAVFIIVALFNLSKKQGSIRYFSFLVMLFFLAIFIRNFEQITTNIQLRLLNTDMTDGSTRIVVWLRVLSCIKNNLGLGTGIGGLEDGMAAVSMSTDVTACHNMFLEIAAVFGLFVFFVFIKVLWNLFPKILKCHNYEIKIPLLCSFLTMPIYSIINSGYLVSAAPYLFFASLYVFVNYEQFRSSY